MIPTGRMVMVGCMSCDYHTVKTQRYGFNIPAALKTYEAFVANIGWDNSGGTFNLR